MLKAEDILSGLQKIANGYDAIAIIWHIVLYAIVIALIAKWQPSNRFFASLMAIPLLLVAIMAWLSGNPFNGAMFSLLFVLMLIFGLRANGLPITPASTVFVIIGMVLVAFGLVYPHFTEGSWLQHLYRSPFGLIPCPTLSVLLGFVLIYNGFGSNAIKMIIIVYGLFYGIFGVLKLSVFIDYMLILGTLSLLAQFITSIRR